MNAPAFAPPHTDADSMHAAFERLRAGFDAEPYPSADTRRGWLTRLIALLKRHEQAIIEAIDADFGGRSHEETRLIEIFPALEALRQARRELKHWMRPERRPVSIWFQPGRARVLHQPKGVVGIIAPWNYPLLLALGPLCGALAAGNRAMLKLSELTPRSSALLAELLAEALPPEVVAVVNGDPEVAAAFSRLPFDHLLFTGSTAVGREVMKAAAERLIPVTLELGGKSPALVAPGFDVMTAAKRIAFAKFLTAGQTCVAPDYALVPEQDAEAFVAELKRVVRQFYSGDIERDITSTISERHYQRLQALVADAEARGARVEPLLEQEALPGRRLPPCAVLDVDDGMRLMQEELFGPLLPVHTYRTLADAVDYIKAHARPLALYLFDEDGARREMILRQTHSGGVCLNDCLVHVAQDGLPFGGIGASGMGAYHGRDGFKTFSHAKGVFHQSRFNALGLFHPPRGRLARVLLKMMQR